MTLPTYCRLHHTHDPPCSLCGEYEPSYEGKNVRHLCVARCQHLTTCRPARRRSYTRVATAKIVQQPAVDFHTFIRRVRKLASCTGITIPKRLIDAIHLQTGEIIQVAIRRITAEEIETFREQP